MNLEDGLKQHVRQKQETDSQLSILAVENWKTLSGLMSLDVKWDNQKVRSEIDVNNIKTWIYPALFHQVRLLLVVVVVLWCGDILAHFGAFTTNWASFGHQFHSLPEYCFSSCPSLYDHSVPSSKG